MVTTVPEGVPDKSHPSAETLAVHVERKLPPLEAALVEEHLAGCPTCYELFAEAVRFRLDDEEQKDLFVPGAVPAATAPLFRRPGARLAAALALAACLALASWAVWRSQHGPAEPSLVADLVRAVGEQRFVEPRLTGGFRYARFVRLRAGGGPQGLDTQPPAVIAAVGRVRERALSDSSPEALRALAVTYLVSGDASAAVKALESATAQDPRDPRLQSDLAAAYLVRASRQDEPVDLPKGLEAAERSIALPNPPIEAWFNRALALENLHLDDAARKAWQQYLERDSASPWADEARKRLADLPAGGQSSVEEDRARVRAALDEGEPSLARLVDESPSIVREYFDGELLGAWAEAQLANRPEARSLGDRAALVGDTLLRTTGDTLPRDAARALSAPPSATCHDPPNLQARGLLAFREAQRRADLSQSSCDVFREAHRLLGAGGSPYAEPARERIVTKCQYPSYPEAALAELGRIERVAQQRGYLRLLGHVRWMQGLIRATRGDLTVALERYRLARASFAELGDAESQAFLSAALAETLDVLGDERRAWADRRSALSSLAGVRKAGYFHSIVEATALACLDQGLPRTALQLLTALVESERVRGHAAILPDALTRRGAVLHALGADERAARDLSEARRSLAGIADPALATRMGAETAALEGALLATRQPERAAGPLLSALGYFAAEAPVRVPDLRRQLGRVYSAQGLADDAERELISGIRLLEAQRASVHDLVLQASFLEHSLPLFDDMVELQLDQRHDEAAALSFVERGRARQLLDSLTARRRPAAAGPLAESEAGFRPEALQSGLPEGLALVYHVCLGDRLLAWLLTRDALRFVEQPLPEAEIERLVAAQRVALERRAPVAVVREAGERLYDILVRPLSPFTGAVRALVFVPDVALEGAAFAALWDGRSSRYLVEEYLLGVAPSGRVLVGDPGRSSSLPPRPRALVVGNPRIDSVLGQDLPPLPGAEKEAVEVASLYPGSELLTGKAATRGAFLAALRASDVVHYAGHATATANDAARSRLFLAPDPAGGDSGALTLRDLPLDTLRARVVVLAACRTAAGSSREDEALSLSRPLLAAGVPNVVGSLWDLDDEISRAFFVAFHRKLLAEGDATRALRDTQLSLLRGSDPVLAHPASWSGFVSAGTVRARPR